ncbi:Ankyrin repeats (3 copies) [Legionella cherrii]|uniref:Ankyrin repeats (3 copies) n=1 Tax=Legionella cherrii TaxID=28084 RepID=A0A0W0SGT4_9GAMM|nr:ankyrin repeat domain-containing protein [Legionella cherrii]KTC82655.1 Ankyrin repeats (3 copies) [Legionella cherrii]
MGKSIKQLFAAIAEIKNKKEIETQLKKIEELAQKVLKKHHTLNVFQEDSDYVHTPLEAAIAAGSIPVFQLLVGLGADPYWKPKPDRPSAIDFFINHYFSRDHYHERGELFEWVLRDKESPLFTWAKLKTNQKLDEAFKKANLKKAWLNELPIHVAIQAGRIDLVQQVVGAAGGLQRAGDISRMSVLSTAINAMLDGQKNTLEILKYLLEHGSSPQTPDVEDAPQLIHLLTRMTRSNIEEFIALAAVNLLLHHGASLDVTDARGYTPLMLAMKVGLPKLFALLVDQADAGTLHHQAQMKPYYLLFQLLDREENRLSRLDVLGLLPKLKEKGLEFDQTIDYHSPADPFEDALYNQGREVSAQNMSLLHFYVDNMTRTEEDPFQAMDHHLEVIQALIAHGANPHAKATFTLTERKNPYYGTDTAPSRIELTASEYARNIVDRMLRRYALSHGAYWIKTFEEENHFLSVISHETKENQISLHKKFHQLRNLERVLSGNKPLPYSGLPDVNKLDKLALNKPNQSKSATVETELDPIQSKAQLLEARRQKNQGNWQVLKKALVDYAKEAESLADFLARVDQFKAPLQLHFNISTDAKGATIYGSTLYRFFHYFDAHKFPNSWETLRKFGQDTYGIDINTPYDEVSTDLTMN